MILGCRPTIRLPICLEIRQPSSGQIESDLIVTDGVLS
jgi:hypothetical protein